MTKSRLDGLQLLLFGSAFFVVAGLLTARINFAGMTDFKQFYYASRCLIEHRDPYKARDLGAVYQAESRDIPSDPEAADWLRRNVSLCPNFPTTFLIVAPLAILPWKLAEAAWMFLTAGSLILASWLMWSLAAQFAPRLSGGMVFLLLINSELLLSLGNTAGLAVGLCVIAAWCFLCERFVPAGIVCMAVSLAMKPHDAGMVWLFFLLAGGLSRRRALQTLGATALLAVPAALWITHVVPHWPQELRSNLSLIMSRGNIDDPGPLSGGAFGVNMIVSLQTVLSRISDNPHFYNPAAYMIVGSLLLPWAWKTLRSRGSLRLACFALAAVVPLSLLPVYHRCYDARLLLLGLPACAMLWAEGGRLGWCAFALSTGAIVLTGDLLWIVAFHLARYSGPAVALELFPGPLILLVLGVFYLWVYLREPVPVLTTKEPA